ncbi:MAG: PAS domain S-box protein [Anaerolineaceae bacterium]
MKRNNKHVQHQETIASSNFYEDQALSQKESSSRSVNLKELLNALTSEVSALIASIDLDYCYTYFNQVYGDEIKRLVGVDLQVGMTVMDVYRDRPEQLAFSLKQWNRSLAGESFKEVAKFPRTEDSENYYEVTNTPIKDDEGSLIGAVIVAKNITHRLDIDHSLSESEMRYQQLFDHVFDGLAICEFLFDKNGQPVDYRILDVNPNFTKMIGSEREQIVGSTYLSNAPFLSMFNLDRLYQVATTGETIHSEGYLPDLACFYELFIYSLPKHCFAIILSDITQRKSKEENINWLASFPEQNPLPVVEIDYDLRITYQNPAAKYFFPEIDRNDQSQPFFDGIKDVSDKYQACEDLVASKDVLIRNTWLHLSFYHMPERKRIRIYSVDITDRINAENELQELNKKLEETVLLRTEELNRLNQELNLDIDRRKSSESALEAERKRFNDVLEVLPVYVILLTPDGHINFANKFFMDYLSRSSCEQCNELSNYRDNSEEMEETFKPFVNGQSNSWEWVGPENRIYAVHDYPFTDVDGSSLILEMGLDITEIRTAQLKLLETSNYNRSLIEANLDFLVTINRDGIITDVNAAAEIASGLKREDLIGNRFDLFFDDPEAANRGLQLVFGTGSVRNYELNLKHKDGHTTPVAYNASFYTNLEGEIVGIFAGARDLTELKRKENQLLELNRALEAAIQHEQAIHDQLVQAEKFAAMGRMLASVTHEISNPLQTISNCLYLISSDIPTESQAQQFLTMAMSETNRISKLVAELKDVYRPRQENNFAPVQLSALLDEIYKLLKPQLIEKRVDWELVRGNETKAETLVNGIDDQLNQVFLNLSMNAMEAMQPKGGRLLVTVDNEKIDEIGVVFSDTGPGIEPENVNKIFDPFFSTKIEGLGLGLSICYDIIQRHHGHIDVSSKPGEGSNFEVWLPRLEGQEHQEK